MTAQQIVNNLLEDEPDVEAEIDRYMQTDRFDRGVASTLGAAREMYLALVKDGVLPMLWKERPMLDDASVADAILRRVLERYSSRDSATAARLLKRWGGYRW